MRHQKTISEKTNESTLNTKIKNTCDCESENTTNNCVINGAWIQHKPTPALAPNHEKCVNKQTPEECKPFNSNVVTNLSPIVNNNIHESFHQTSDKTLQNENYSCDANNTNDHISNKNIASLNDLETVSCIHTLLGKMKSCKIDVSPKKVIYKKHRVIYYIVDLYRKIRLFVNMGSIIIFIFAILSVIFCMASCYTRLSTLSLRLENIDMTIDKEISLQIKINASAIYNISMQVSSFSISIISNETKNRILKIKAKEVDIHILNNGCLITLNFKGLLNKKTCLLNTIKEIQKSGFIISLKFNVHFNNFFGLKSNIHATKTINCPPKTDNNGGINIVHILKGEPVYFGATHIYNKTNITDLLFFSANMEHDDSINSEIFPINWPNFERFSILITNLEICYTGDNKKDKKIFFEYLRIKNGKLLSFKTDCHSENPICTQARIAATYISNKNITFKKIAINGVSILLDPWTINTTNKTENSETYDYKIQVNHFAFEYIDISYKQTNIRDSVIESFIKSKPQGAKGAVFLTSRTGKPLLIGNLSLIIVYRKEMLLRLHLTNIKWQVFINAIKVRGIVQITIEGSDKFVWFACLRSLKFSETINELYKKTDKSVDQCGILLETRSASNEQSDRINNYLNLKVPKKSKFYKSKVQIDIGETKVQLTNDLFSIHFSSQKTTIKKMRNSSRLEKDFQFDLQIKPHDKHMLLRDHSIEKFMSLKTENGQEINLTELSRGVCGIKEAVTLTNIIELKAVKDQVCSVTIKTTEKLSGCINWKIKFPDQYALFSKNEKLKIINFSPIDIYVEGGKVLFNDVSFSLKFDDILTDLLFQQWQFLDFNCTTSTDYAISLLINFMFMRNNKKDAEKTVCDNSSNKTIATSKTIHELFSESGLSSTELDLFNKEQLNSQIKNSLTVVNDSRNDLKTQINKIDSELDSIISEYTSNAISIIKLKIDVADEYETLYFSLTFNKPISAREIIEKCKYNFLNLNFHSYFSEGNADAEIHEELNEITKKIMKILNFPFNQTKINFESIELNMKENDKETNVFKILFSKNIFTGKSQQIKIKVEIKLIHLLKLFKPTMPNSKSFCGNR
ncbi:hypothetical protein CDIK_0299 [Cucumispora dikerogammari]|nr:hypothetical protein CDIK_0299 [Cucumispora dikerogammari]